MFPVYSDFRTIVYDLFLGYIVFTLSIQTDRQTRANSVAPDQTPQNAASDLGLHCLSFIQQFFSA